MTWTNLIVEINSNQTEALSDVLLLFGALSITVEDAQAGTAYEKPQFGEPDEKSPAPIHAWECSRIIALFDSNERSPAKIEKLLADCCNTIGIDMPKKWHTELVAEENWVAQTQAQFTPIKISEHLWVVPSWHPPPMPGAINIILDPGMAFGTGSHPTTQLCLQWLEHRIAPNVSLLDYGCGSGILAIAGAKLGANPVIGIDIDPQAIITAEENAKHNHVKIKLYSAKEEISNSYDLVVANILANPLRILAPSLFAHVNPGGWLALSGILQTQAEEIITIYAPYLSLEVFAECEGWVCLEGQKPSE